MINPPPKWAKEDGEHWLRAKGGTTLARITPPDARSMALATEHRNHYFALVYIPPAQPLWAWHGSLDTAKEYCLLTLRIHNRV